MSTTGLEVFDKTVHTTNAWLKEIMEVTGPDRHRAYRVLAAVLHALRDRLTVTRQLNSGPSCRFWFAGSIMTNGITLPANPKGYATRTSSSRLLQPNWMTSSRSIRSRLRAPSFRCSNATSPPAR